MSEAVGENEELIDLRALDLRSSQNEEIKWNEGNNQMCGVVFGIFPNSEKDDDKVRAKWKMCGATYLAANKYEIKNLKCHIETYPRRSSRNIG